jgi:hypothetical protein
VRFITLRWVEEAPKPSDELKNIVGVPLSRLPALIAKKDHWVPPGSPAGTLGLGLILGHEVLLDVLLAHKDVRAFLSSITGYYAEQRQQSAPGGSVW